MKLKTIRVRRTRPSAPAFALALALTMLCVYLLSLNSPATNARGDAAAALAPGEAELCMEGLSVGFVCEGRRDSLTEARIAAANCAADGGAGLLLSDDGSFAVVREAVSGDAAPEGALLREGRGLTLRLSGPASEIAAISDAVDALRTLAVETSDLAMNLEAGGDAGSLSALLDVYRTRCARASAALEDISGEETIVERLREAVRAELAILEDAAATPAPNSLRLLHASACCQWLELLSDLAGQA